MDAMCIPTCAKNKDVAEEYINFMLSVDEEYGAPAIANAEYTYYASPNRKVIESESYHETMNSIKPAVIDEATGEVTTPGAFDLMYDKEALKTATYYQNLTPEKLALINELWEELKSDISISPVIIIICVASVGTLVAAGIFLGTRKKFRNNY